MLTILLVVANSFVVRELIDGVIEDVESAAPQEYEEIIANFKRIEKYCFNLKNKNHTNLKEHKFI